MKALTKITLANGDELKSPHDLETMTSVWAQMHRQQPGSLSIVATIDGHGRKKNVALLAGTILKVQEL